MPTRLAWASAVGNHAVQQLARDHARLRHSSGVLGRSLTATMLTVNLAPEILYRGFIEKVENIERS
jgi:hypothetical protein